MQDKNSEALGTLELDVSISVEIIKPMALCISILKMKAYILYLICHLVHIINIIHYYTYVIHYNNIILCIITHIYLKYINIINLLHIYSCFSPPEPFFFDCHMAWRILVPQPEIEPVPPEVEGQSPIHWTIRELPSGNLGNH